MRIKDLIEKLQDFEARYGSDAEVVFIDQENGRFVCMPVGDVSEAPDVLWDVAHPYTSPVILLA